MAKAEFYQIQTVGRTLVRQKYLTPEPRAEARPTKKKDKQRPVGAQFNPRMARLHSRSEDRSYKIQIHQAVGRTLVRQTKPSYLLVGLKPGLQRKKISNGL